MVLRSFGPQSQDLVELWIRCRAVSKHFKHEVEEFLIANYLPHASLLFDITTSQGFNQNSKIQFRDHRVQTKYSRVSMDRAGAFFKAEDHDEAKFLQQVHNGGRFYGPSHLLDFSRPSNDVALPGVVFHANGEVEVGWRELFAAVLAEENYYYRTGRIPAGFDVSQIEEDSSMTDAEKTSMLMVAQGYRQAEVFESTMSKGSRMEAPTARVFHMIVMRTWHVIENRSRPELPRNW